jgi:hypothetical protein
MDFTDDEVKKIWKRRRSLSRRRYFYFKWLESKLIPPVPVRPTDATSSAADDVAGRSRGGCDQSIYGHKTMDESHDGNKDGIDQSGPLNGGDMPTVIAPETGVEATLTMDDDHESGPS